MATLTHVKGRRAQIMVYKNFWGDLMQAAARQHTMAFSSQSSFSSLKQCLLNCTVNDLQHSMLLKRHPIGKKMVKR